MSSRFALPRFRRGARVGLPVLGRSRSSRSFRATPIVRGCALQNRYGFVPRRRPFDIDSEIVVLCGPPGTGKTTVARGLKRRLAAAVPERRVRRFDSDDFASRTYERLAERVAATAADSHGNGVSARPAVLLVAGTFYRRAWREQFRALADRDSIDGIRFVRLQASLETCLERNGDRPDAIDDQGVHVVHREFDPIDADATVDTEATSPAEAVDRVATLVTDRIAET